MKRSLPVKAPITLSLCLTVALLGCQSVADTQTASSANASGTANVSTPSSADSARSAETGGRSERKTVQATSGQGTDEMATAPNPEVRQDPAGFEAWVDAFRQRAASEGIDQATLAEAFDRASYQPRILEYDRSQPEFTRQIWSYLDSAVSAQRVSTGRERLAANRATADQVTQQYGVPGEVIVAIWGIESNYGSNFGDFETIDALSTLGFDGRRQSFARGELMAALKILQNGDIDRDRMRGSWAGAMGHTQFIPSSFLAYAVDEDGDGRRDIWGSIPDVMGSTANYLDASGWQRGQPWGVEVKLPDDFDYSQTELSVRHTAQTWQSRGVTRLDGSPLPSFDQASVIAPAGAKGPAFLVGHNFRVIMRYNASTSYALAVATLSDRLAGRPGIQGEWPRSEPALSRDRIRRMQQGLNDQGFDVGTPDGLVGPNTRAGLRAYQRSIGVIPDGYPTQSLIQRLTDG